MIDYGRLPEQTYSSSNRTHIGQHDEPICKLFMSLHTYTRCKKTEDNKTQTSLSLSLSLSASSCKNITHE